MISKAVLLLSTSQNVLRGNESEMRIQAGTVTCCLGKLVFTVASAIVANSVHADNSTPEFSVRGFGTIGITHANTREADYVGTLRQPTGAGFTDNWAIGVDSKLGLQLDAKLTEQLTGVVQIVSQHQTDNTYTPRVEWANLKYQPHPDFSFRIGRVLRPTFLAADSRLVGYANTWIRPPIEVYNLGSITKSDGIDASYRMHFGELTNTVQAIYGRSNEDFISSTATQSTVISVRSRDVAIAVDTVEVGPWTVHASITTEKLVTPALEGRDKIYSLGAAYDAGNWFIQSEWGRLILPSGAGGLSSQQDALYAMFSYRWNNFTPYAIYSRTWPSGDTPPSGSQGNNQETYSAGLRWDVAKNTALKVQFDRVSPGKAADQFGYFINVQPGFPFGGKVNVISIVVGFVF